LVTDIKGGTQTEGVGSKTLSSGMISQWYQLQMSFVTFYHVALVRTDISEKISPSSGFLRVIGPHSCVTVESLLVSLSIEGYSVGSNNTVFWDDFTVVSLIDVIWDYVPCGSS
jgi:hypothetical protein